MWEWKTQMKQYLGKRQANELVWPVSTLGRKGLTSGMALLVWFWLLVMDQHWASARCCCKSLRFETTGEVGSARKEPLKVQQLCSETQGSLISSKWLSVAGLDKSLLIRVFNEFCVVQSAFQVCFCHEWACSLLQQKKNFILSVLVVAFCCVGADSGNEWLSSLLLFMVKVLTCKDLILFDGFFLNFFYSSSHWW